MSGLDRRLRALEEEAGGNDPLVVMIRSFVGTPNEPVKIVSTDGTEWVRQAGESADGLRERALSGPHSRAFVVLREYNKASADVRQWARYEAGSTA